MDHFDPMRLSFKENYFAPIKPSMVIIVPVWSWKIIDLEQFSFVGRTEGVLKIEKLGFSRLNNGRNLRKD